MVQRAGLVPIPSGVNDFKRVERWMADLYRQHDKAEEYEQQAAPAVDAGGRPEQSWHSINLATQSHSVSQSQGL
jgi:hypothetical protein